MIHPLVDTSVFTRRTKACTAYFTGLKCSTRCMNTCAPACSASETNLQTNDLWACSTLAPSWPLLGASQPRSGHRAAKNTPWLWYHNYFCRPPFKADFFGSYDKQYCRSWLCKTLFWQKFQAFWTAQGTSVRQRPPLHIKFLESFMQTPWHQPQHVHISSPSNRRPNRTCQPHDWRHAQSLCSSASVRLGWTSHCCWVCLQQ